MDGGRGEGISWAQTEAMIWGKRMNIRSVLYHPRIGNILWREFMMPPLTNIMKP